MTKIINCEEYSKVYFDEQFMHIDIPLYNGEENKLLSFNISLRELAAYLSPYLKKED